jgi:hypothetical protein
MSLSETLQQAVKVTRSLGKTLMAGETEQTLANASCYLHLFGHICVAWMWLRQANAAAIGLNGADGDRERHFYEGKLQAAQYFSLGVTHRRPGPGSAAQYGRHLSGHESRVVLEPGPVNQRVILV